MAMFRRKADRMKTTYNCIHIDTCLPCYLSDHHRRPGEMLLQARVDSATTYKEVVNELLSEIHGAMPEDESFDYDQAELAILNTVLNVDAPFDDSLESDDDDSEDSCYAWFVLSWPTADSEED